MVSVDGSGGEIGFVGYGLGAAIRGDRRSFGVVFCGVVFMD
jgi:hypothetical protein